MLAVTALPGPYMPAHEPEPPKGPKTKAIRLRVRTVEMLEDVSEATGEPLWKTVERLLGPGLPAEHKAVQPQLRKVRELEAKKAEVQQQARKDHPG